jgi:hypothetical protein
MSARARAPLLICLVAVLVSAVAAASATAAPELIWKVNEKTLAAGESRAVKTEEAKGVPFKIRIPVGESSQIAIECEKLVSKNGEIKGGVPGKYESTLELSGCKSPEFPKCVITEPVKAAVKAELVENTEEKKDDILFTPKVLEKPFTEVVVTGSSCIPKGTYPIEGNFAGEISPQNEEVEELEAKFPSPPVKEVINSKKEKVKVETTVKKAEVLLVHTVFCGPLLGSFLKFGVF